MRVMAVLIAAIAIAPCVQAAELHVLTTGAAKQVASTIAERFAARGGHKIILVQDTAGGVKKRMEAGEVADIVVAPPGTLDGLAEAGLVAKGTRFDFARTGVGVGVREGAAKPDISSVDAFKAALIAATAIALPDPKAGGTSALYLDALFKKLGVADVIAAKARYQAGGYAADLVANGTADLVIHQISEIRPVKGVVVVGPLPADIQSITTYSVALAARAVANDAARALLSAFASDEGRATVKDAGMEAARLDIRPGVNKSGANKSGAIEAAWLSP